MKLKKTIAISLLITASAIVIWGVETFNKHHTALENDCSVAGYMRDTSTHFSARLNVHLSLNNDNTGYLDIMGKMNHDGVSYNTARAWRFDYTLQKGNILYMTRLRLEKRAADNAPDDLVDSQLFSIAPDSSHYVKIASLNNAWVIGNLYSPQFFCPTGYKQR